MEFFKANNKKWIHIKSFVIDKNFGEWFAINKCFRDAKVLLCQYHVISFWRKLLQKRKSNLKTFQREKIEQFIQELIYCPTEWLLNASTALFVLSARLGANLFVNILIRIGISAETCGRTLRDLQPLCRKYYDKPGEIQLESVENDSWQKTRLDMTIAGLLRHQITIVRQ